MNTESHRAVALTGLMLATLCVADASGRQEGSDARGTEIATEADHRVRGFGDYKARLDMILTDRRGQETLRELELWALEVPPDEERSLVYFHSPRDIRGTSLLTYSYPERENEQWLYLPALRRTKRIAATGRSSPFMGSEFAYEDLVPARVSQFAYRLVAEESLEGQECFVLERIPQYEGTGYGKQRLWIDKTEYRVLRVDSWDLRDRLLKTLTLSGYERHPDGIWRPSDALMVNHRTNERSALRWHDYEFETGLTEGDFSRSALGRVR